MGGHGVVVRGKAGTIIPTGPAAKPEYDQRNGQAPGALSDRGAAGTMRERKIRLIGFAVLALILVLMLVGCESFRGKNAGTPPTLSPTVPPSPTPTPLMLDVAEPGERRPVMELAEDGSFYPESRMTRLEAAQILAGLLNGLPQGEDGLWTDLNSGDPGYAAAASLYAAGLVKKMPGGTFRPEDEITRGDLATALFKLSSMTVGEERERVGQLARDLTTRALPGCGGGNVLTRAELAVVWMRLVGQLPYDEDRLILDGYVPADVTQDNEAWAYITTSVMTVAEEEMPVPAPGLHRLYGWLYAADENGALVRDQSLGLWDFGPDGRYTTGDERLDGYLAEAMRASGASALEGEEALKAAYLYVKHNFEYEITPEDGPTEANGSTDWINTRAERFLRLGAGTCYGYASTFGLMARCLGEQAYIVAGQVNEYYTPHGYVIIPEDGVDWIYDIELEDTRPERHADLDLFHIKNFAIYMYWYQPAW